MRLMLALALALSAGQDDVSSLLERLAGDDEAAAAEAATALVAKGKEARAAVETALRKAKKDHRSRLEDVLLRIDGGVDGLKASLGGVDAEISDASWALVEKNGAKWAEIKARFGLDNRGDAAAAVELVKGTLITLKGPVDLIVKGPDKKPFSKEVGAGASSGNFVYGNLITPRWPEGTRALLVFELKVGGETAKIRSASFELTQ